MKIQFKTKEPFFSKEEGGDKCNTVREVYQGNDERFEYLMFLIQADDYGGIKAKIDIFNPDTGDYFQRLITDVTYFDGRFIISWQHKPIRNIKTKRNGGSK